MSRTQKYREQHNEILSIAQQISAQLEAERLTRDAGQAAQLLARLFGKLKLHLALEDSSLYPDMMKHSNAVTVATAKRFADEMGRIAEAVKQYSSKWSTANVIQSAPEGFIKETKDLFTALSRRIDRENNELYPQYDKLQ